MNALKLEAAQRLAASSVDDLRSPAWKAGYKAFGEGKQLADNPYWETIDKTAWKLGWGAARDKS